MKYAAQGAHCTLRLVTQGWLEDQAATTEDKQVYLQDLLTINQKAQKSFELIQSGLTMRQVLRLRSVSSALNYLKSDKS